VLARALLRSGGERIGPEHLDLQPPFASGNGTAAGPSDPLEVGMIRSALTVAGGSITGAAQRIGWSRQKLYRRMRALNLGR
jgi:transcriptional regulator of acetoin/glycerol metabolism